MTFKLQESKQRVRNVAETVGHTPCMMIVRFPDPPNGVTLKSVGEPD